MQYIVPHYYRKFQCTAQRCPDTCCAGWQIMIDKSSLKKYRKVKSSFGNRLKNEVDWRTGSFREYKGRCAFLNEDNLCDIYREAGEQMLCRTCRLYPRHIEEYEGLREISLSLSCPEVVRILLEMKEPVRFLKAENEREEKPYLEFDFLLFTKLMDTRDLSISILQNRKYSIDVRMAMVLALAHDFQQRIDKNLLSETDTLLARYSQPESIRWFQEKVYKMQTKEEHVETSMYMLKKFFRLLDSLEVLQEEWIGYLENIRQKLKEKKNRIKNEIWIEQIMIYFVFTYFCGAVYDSSAYSKMKFSFVCTILIREILLTIDIEKPGEEKQILAADVIHRFAREVEHSDKNKRILEQLLEREETFPLERLLEAL
ncbi:flagellin lysine-N-methylase [Mediterraneibacter sp. NSJ-55]|uniref:Flagellin lysine-N-methylase n=1 Tax=Mediterraneibacter hominis TaxID=2763054 RepID=A0A923LGZ6_9FIRM|nr:flagellin lysine-N-methylase [Mediterraneibacter hominis]MBC5687906.1 flagellin lysine-N-methylase [Mediterraneibacter hominis]